MIVLLSISIWMVYSSTKIHLDEDTDLDSLIISTGNEYNIIQTAIKGSV